MMVNYLVVGLDSGSNYESRAFLFRVVLEFEGLWFEGSCVFGCLNEIKGLGSDEGGGSYSWWVVWVWVGWSEAGLVPPLFVET